MEEDWRNIFEILMYVEIWDGSGMGICDGTPSTCSSFVINFVFMRSSLNPCLAA